MSNEQLVRRVRLYIFEHFMNHAQAPVGEQLMNEFSLSRDEAAEILRELEAARHIALVPGTARILMAFPFSAIATPFRVAARGQAYFANCAWDAIAFHAMLRDDVRVDSFCHHCGTPITVELRDGRATRVEPEETLVVPRAAPHPVVGEHRRYLLQHHGLLRLTRAPRRVRSVCTGR